MIREYVGILAHNRRVVIHSAQFEALLVRRKKQAANRRKHFEAINDWKNEGWVAVSSDYFSDDLVTWTILFLDLVRSCRTALVRYLRQLRNHNDFILLFCNNY